VPARTYKADIGECTLHEEVIKHLH